MERSIRMLEGLGRPVGGPYRRDGGGGAGGGSPIFLERLKLRIDKAFVLYKANQGFFALSELEDLQREVGLSPIHPVGLRSSQISPIDTALRAIDTLLAAARELKGRESSCLLISGSAEFASDLYSKRAELDAAARSRTIDQLLGCIEDLISLERAESADKILRFLQAASDFSHDQLSKMGTLLVKTGKLDQALTLLVGGYRSGKTSLYFDLVAGWPEFVEQNLAVFLPGMRDALREGIQSFKSKGINVAGLIDCELSILTTLLEHSPRAALTAYQNILLPLVNREKPIDPTGALRPIAEAIQEVNQRPEVAAAFPSTNEMLTTYFDAIAEFVKQVLILKNINPQEGLWHEIPIILRMVPDAKFTPAMAAFTKLYLAYAVSPRDLNPKAMRQILPLLPRDKFEAALRSMADMVWTGIDPLTRMDELVK